MPNSLNWNQLGITVGEVDPTNEPSFRLEKARKIGERAN